MRAVKVARLLSWAVWGLRAFAPVVAIAVSMVSSSLWAQTPVTGPFPSWPGGSLEPAAVGPNTETVMGRPRPDYDPLGVRVGAWVFSPAVALVGTYNSNIFATQNGAVSDFLVTENPSLSMKSDWNQHAVALNMSGSFTQHVRRSSEDVNNASVDLAGRYDIGYGEYI